MGIQNWAEITIDSLLNLWISVLDFIPFLIGALAIVIVGLIIAHVLKTLVERVIGVLKIDSLLEKTGIGVYFERAGMKINSGKFFGLLVYWFFIIVVLESVSEVLGLYNVSWFLRDIASYFPNIIVAVIIMLAAIVAANFSKTLIKASVQSAKLHSPKFLGALTWWAIVIFGFLTALVQLGVAVSIINTIITGLIAMVALAGGIAFGLGGKEYASHLIDRLRQQTEER